MSEKYYNEGTETGAVEKKAKRSINGGLIIFIIGMIITAVGVCMCYNTDLNKYFKTKDYNISFAADKVANINIENKVGDYTIKKGSGKDIIVDAKAVSEDFTAELNGNTLTINSPKTKNFWISIPMLTYKTTSIEISLPEKQYDSLIFNGGTGDTELNSINIKDIVFKTGTGDKDFIDITCDNLDVINGTGDSKIDGLTCDSCKFKAGTGDIKFSDIDCKGELEIESGTGDTTINDCVSSGIEVEHGTGDFKFNGTVNGDIKVKSGVGDLEVNLTNPETDFGKNGKYKMFIDKGVGDKDITYNN